MRNAILKFKLMVMALGAILILSCSGDDGEDGIDGINGIDGVDGADGADGNANVVSVLVSGVDIVIGDNTIDLPELTQDIFDTGFVIGYTRVPANTDSWESLPVVIGSEVRLDFTEIQVGSVILESTFNQTLNFRFVLVAGTSATGKTSQATTLKELEKAGIDINNHREVMDYFGLDY